MNIWLIAVGWTAISLVAGRVAFMLMLRDNGGLRSGDGEEAFAGVLAAAFWPILLALAILAAPFFAIGWLLSRPTRMERARAVERRDADAAQHAALRQAETIRLAREFDLPDGQP
jgi:hypothetical protein